MHARVLLAFIALCMALGYGKEKWDNSARLTYGDELLSHSLNDQASGRKEPELLVLGFVTPWNSRGKDVAMKQASRGRLDTISPVTWQMHPDGLFGGEDFEDSFYEDLAKMGSEVFPRVLFEKWDIGNFEKLSTLPEPLVLRIAQMCERSNSKGVVLEIWQAMLAAGALQGEHKTTSLGLIKALGEGLREKHGLRTVLVLPPYSGPTGDLGVDDFARLDVAFNHFVVMTYDFSTPGSQPGPMAPIKWVRGVGTFLAKDCGLGRRVLLGLNFYGLDFLERGEGQAPDGRHVLGHEYISLLEQHKPELFWLEELGEHAFGYGKDGAQHMVFYPTKRSVGMRVKLAKELGCGGVAIWELGQGLDHFFDEF